MQRALTKGRELLRTFTPQLIEDAIEIGLDVSAPEPRTHAAHHRVIRTEIARTCLQREWQDHVKRRRFPRELQAVDYSLTALVSQLQNSARTASQTAIAPASRRSV